jgi:DNA-binding transcriptional LysR family regulator
LLEAAHRQRGLPFSTAVEAEGYDLQLSLISEGVGFGMVMPQVFYSSALRKHLKVVKVKDFSPKLSVWLLHSRHLGRLAPAARCVGEAVKQQLQARRTTVA